MQQSRRLSALPRLPPARFLGIELAARFLDAIYLPVRPSGAKEGVLLAWGIDSRRVRNLLAKIPAQHRQRVRARYWQALDEATGKQDGERWLRELVGELSDQGFESAAACRADDLEALCVHLGYPLNPAGVGPRPSG